MLWEVLSKEAEKTVEVVSCVAMNSMIRWFFLSVQVTSITVSELQISMEDNAVRATVEMFPSRSFYYENVLK